MTTLRELEPVGVDNRTPLWAPYKRGTYVRDFAVSEEVLPGTPEPAGTQGRSRNCAEDTCHRGAVIDRRSEERGAVRRQGSFRNTVPAADAPSSSACSSLRAELAFGSVRRSSAPAHTLPSRNGNQQSSVSKISGRFRAPGAVLEDLSSGRPNGPNPLTKSQLEFLLDPTRLFRDSAAPKNENCFVGPLNEIFSNGKITKPGRSVPPGSSEWAAGVTECSRWWYPAEDSGLVTFWQAVLIASDELRNALDALKCLSENDAIKFWMLEAVYFAMGQLVNTIGQSWDLDHERNLERLNGAARHEINRQSLHHRHLRLGKWLWRVLAKFEMAVNQRQISCVTIIEAHEDYQRFFVYLMCTGRMVLQDALLTYRKHLTSKNFSCVGHADNTDNAFQDEEMHRNIMRLLAGATPSNQRVRRFRAMGYSYLWVKTFAEIDVLAYKKTFRRPLWRIIKAAKPFHALSGFREKWTITSTDAESLQHETPSRLSTGTSHSNDHDAELD